MKVNVKVTPRASKNSIEYCEDDNLLKIKTTAAPVSGKANEAVINLIADYLNVPKSDINIVVGGTSKNKIIEVCSVTSEDLIKKPKLF